MLLNVVRIFCKRSKHSMAEPIITLPQEPLHARAAPTFPQHFKKLKHSMADPIIMLPQGTSAPQL